MSDETITAESAQISGYIPFSYECDYCGETHKDLMGIFITMFHTLLSAIALLKKAITK